MKTFQSMAIGGCLVAVAVVGLQGLPDVQWIVVLGVFGVGVVALVTLAIDAFAGQKPHLAPQPVVQPVVQPVDAPAQPYWPVADTWSQPAQPVQPVADAWSQPLAQPVVLDMQPVATAPQPPRNRLADLSHMIVDPIPAVRHVPWLEQKVEPMDIDDDPVDLPDVPEPALPLPRRSPTAAEYPLVWQAIQDQGSMNAAILAVYGSKDGKTHRWVSKVIEFYRSGQPLTEELGHDDAIFCYELAGTCDLPGMVAARLGLEMDDHDLATLLEWFDQCDECNCWYLVTSPCPCQRETEVA